MITNTQKTIIKAIKETKDKDVLEWLIEQLASNYMKVKYPSYDKNTDLYVVYQIRALTKDTPHVEEDLIDCRTTSLSVSAVTDTKYYGGVVIVTDDEDIAYECAKLSNDEGFKTSQIARGVYKSTNKKHPEYIWYRYVQKVTFDKATQHKNRFYEIKIDKK